MLLTVLDEVGISFGSILCTEVNQGIPSIRPPASHDGDVTQLGIVVWEWHDNNRGTPSLFAHTRVCSPAVCPCLPRTPPDPGPSQYPSWVLCTPTYDSYSSAQLRFWTVDAISRWTVGRMHPRRERIEKSNHQRVQQAFGRMALSEPIRCFHQNILNV